MNQLLYLNFFCFVLFLFYKTLPAHYHPSWKMTNLLNVEILLFTLALKTRALIKFVLSYLVFACHSLIYFIWHVRLLIDLVKYYVAVKRLLDF